MVEPIDPELCRGSAGPALILLRHGAVASHQGDVPLTREGRAQAERAGRRLAELDLGRVEILVGPTVRAQQTGRMLLRGLTRASPSTVVTGPSVASALRNPDLYLAGHRVDMVSTAAAFAEQVPGVTEADVTSVDFFAGFLRSEDRVGCWLYHTHPPGDNAAAVAARVRQFALSLGHARTGQPDLVVGVTHSPVLRAVAAHYLGSDPGEPGHLHGYFLRPLADRSCDLHFAAIRLGREVAHGREH
jgi:broad specificity phosphatase PhoE